MDYDDNDLQSQNFQLAGEETIKFPPGLRSYALPKFDLDDSLQVHLRFDSLVETEALLGIQSQEQNQWIEDFSRGSSVIEFSSGAAESCSISRHNNVWSEATSSESVEMLLNSVGQDELIMEQTIIEESDVCDELGSLTNQMEPNLKQDGSTPSKTGVLVDSSCALPFEECLESLTGLNKDAVMELSEIEPTSQTHESEKSEHGSSGDLDPCSVSEKYGLPVTEGSVLIDGKCTNANQREDGPLVDGSLDNRTGNDPTTSKKVDNLATSMQNIIASVGELNSQGSPQQGTDIAYENAEGLQKVDDEKGVEHQVLNKEAQTDVQNCEGYAVESKINNEENPFRMTMDSKLQIAEGKVAETSINIVENPFSLALTMDSTVMQIAEGCSEDACSINPTPISDCEVVASSKDTELDDQLIGNTHEASVVVVEGNNNSYDRLTIEIGDTNAGIDTSLELKMDSVAQITNVQSNVIFFEKQEDLLETDGHQLETDSVSNSETSLLTLEDNKLFAGDGDRSSKSNVGDISSLTAEVCSSANLLCETLAIGNVKDGLDGLGVQVDNFNAKDHISSSMQVEPMQACEKNLVVGQSEIHNSKQDVSVLEKGNACLHIDSGNMDCKSDGCLTIEKKATSSSLGQSTAEIEVTAHKSSSYQIVGDEPVSTGVFLEDPNVASCNTLDGVHHLLSANGVATDIVIEHQEDGKSPLLVGNYTHSDKKEETVTKFSTEPSSSAPKEFSQMESVPVPVSEFEQGAIHDNTGQGVCETVGLSSSPKEAVSISFQNEPQEVVANKATPEHSKELEVCPVLHDSTVKENDDAEVIGVAFENYEEASLRVAGIMPSKGETLTKTLPLSMEESSCGISQKDQFDIGQKDREDSDASLVSRDNSSMQIVLASTDDTFNGCEGATRPASLSECNAEFDAPETGSKSPNSDEPNCGSPTVISYSMLSQSEKENPEGGKGSLDQNSPVSDAIDGVGNPVGYIPHDRKRIDASEDDKSFTFEVSSMTDLSDRETDKGWKPFLSIQACEFPQTVEGSASTTSGSCIMDPKMLQEIPRETPQASDGENVCGSSKGTSERKTRRVSSKAADKETSKEGKLLKQITSVRKTAERGAKSCNVSPSSLGTISQVVQAKDVRPYGYIEGRSTKVCAVPTVQTSNLPDLNTSASPSALFQQPFSDFQQVQLRAQIFVYGSLIQGMAPDEACMISAFGESDGGRSVWDNVWRVAVERFHNQKSPLSNPETPQQSRSGAKAPEQATRQSALQSIALPSPVGRAGSKGTPSAIINPVIPLSSPLWNMSTPSRDGSQPNSMPRGPFLDSHQALSPLQPYQSPHIRNYVGHTTPWLSQPSSPRPWIVSPQTSALDAGAHYSALPITETVHVTSIRESFVPRPSGMKLAPPSPLVHSGGPMSVFTGTAPLVEAKKTVSPAKHASVDTKSRKRKKIPTSEEIGQICSPAQAETEPILAPDVTTHLSTSTAITTPGSSAPKSTPGNFTVDISPMSSAHYQITGGRDTEQGLVFSEEMCSKVEQAKLHAEDATAFAAAAVRHSQGIWSKLADQKNSGLVSDVEAKLASAAVAVAAAASVAKAAAAAAKVASDAALQAKLMADEALVSSRTGNPIQSTETSFDVNNLGRVTPASILKGKDRTNSSSSSSIIVAAREAAKKRVEAASAATKRAENLSAVVKAAELAAEAITQAGTVIAMGDPLPLTMSELVEAGPEGYWKRQQVSSDLLVESNSRNKGEQTNIDGVVEGLYAKHFNKQPSNKKEAKSIYQGKRASSKEMARESVEDHVGLVKGMLWDPGTSTEKQLGGQKSSKVSDSAKTIGVVPESEIGTEFASTTVQNEDCEGHQPVRTSKENSIREGSLVEVLSDEDGLRRVWFSAKVLSLKDEKAYVCYTELPPNEDSGKLEWVAINGEGDNAPKVRIAHPMTTMKFEGTRKRRRGATGDYAWSVGDRVDAWIRDGWWEGIITEKSKEDETTLTIQFPDQGDTSIVRAWDLRPSLVWKDEQWMEWSSPRENNCYPHKGDTPQEKRLKLGSYGAVDPAVETRGKDKMSKSIAIEESGKLEESRSLALSAKEKIFNVGKNIREENTSNALRTKRTGLQKEGSRVIFGVPKPGKKRKFMEVSKHYVADRGGKINEGNDPIKFAKYLIPQGSGSRGWKNTSKVVSKEKRPAESKPKVLKSGKPQSVPSRGLPQKDNSLTSAVSNDGSVRDHLPNVKASVSHDESMPGKQNLIDIGPFPNPHKAAEGQVLFSLSGLPTDSTSSEKKSSSAVETDWVNRGKLAPSGAKLARIEEKDTGQNDYPGKSIPEVVEPRRSNRRIQPTSRLLEGLQSSLIVSKIPAVPHDKGTKAQHRSTPSSRGNNHR